MSQLFTLQNNKIVIDDLVLKNTEGQVTHQGDVTLNGTLTVDNLVVRTLTEASPSTHNSSLEEPGNWTAATEDELNGKGFSWTWGAGNVRLAYRNGGRLWSTGDIDLDNKNTYKIDNTTVLSLSELGPTVKKSNLRQVGPLNSLNVLGDATLGEFAFFNTGFNRLGLGTDEPNASITILDNDVEIGIGSPKYGLATIGTYSSHDIGIVSDNIIRVLVKHNGEVHIGDEIGKTGVLKVFGTLHAENVVSDTRIERTTPLEFKADRDSSIYGKGLVWTGNGVTRQLVMMGAPDRLHSSESFDLAENQCYYINGHCVVTENSLGQSVTKSNLQEEGVLNTLTVNGDTSFGGTVNVTNLNTTSIASNTNLSLRINNSEVFYSDANEISLGNKTDNRKPIKLFGPVSVGVNNPDPTVSFSVNGNISINNKKFVTGVSAPTSGNFVKGDICWNQDPKPNNYVGWICINDGAPGEWMPFGAIGR